MDSAAFGSLHSESTVLFKTTQRTSTSCDPKEEAVSLQRKTRLETFQFAISLDADSRAKISLAESGLTDCLERLAKRQRELAVNVIVILAMLFVLLSLFYFFRF